MPARPPLLFFSGPLFLDVQTHTKLFCPVQTAKESRSAELSEQSDESVLSVWVSNFLHVHVLIRSFLYFLLDIHTHTHDVDAYIPTFTHACERAAMHACMHVCGESGRSCSLLLRPASHSVGTVSKIEWTRLVRSSPQRNLLFCSPPKYLPDHHVHTHPPTHLTPTH